jgi:hypothetical protein
LKRACSNRGSEPASSEKTAEAFFAAQVYLQPWPIRSTLTHAPDNTAHVSSMQHSCDTVTSLVFQGRHDCAAHMTAALRSATLQVLLLF